MQRHAAKMPVAAARSGGDAALRRFWLFASLARSIHGGSTWPASAISVRKSWPISAACCAPWLAKLYVGLDNPDFNFTIRTAPSECVGVQ
jgi:hypothetical protein